MSSSGPVLAREMPYILNASENLCRWTSYILFKDKNGETGKEIFARVEELDLTGGQWDEMLTEVFKGIFSAPVENWHWGLIFATFATVRAVQVAAKRAPSTKHLMAILLRFINTHLKTWMEAHGGWRSIPQFVDGL